MPRAAYGKARPPFVEVPNGLPSELPRERRARDRRIYAGSRVRARTPALRGRRALQARPDRRRSRCRAAGPAARGRAAVRGGRNGALLRHLGRRRRHGRFTRRSEPPVGILTTAAGYDGWLLSIMPSSPLSTEISEPVN